MNVIGFHTRHDSNVAITTNGSVRAAWELERIFGVRYFKSSLRGEYFLREWQRVQALLTAAFPVEEYDVGVTSWVHPWQKTLLAAIFPAKRWVTVDHHVAHATAAFYDSGFASAMVVSFDGGGNDGAFNIFLATAGKLVRVANLPYNIGSSYRLLGTLMPEVAGEGVVQPRGGALALAGKLMAYASLGVVRPDWQEAVRRYYSRYHHRRPGLRRLLKELDLTFPATGLPSGPARDLAAAAQAAFEAFVVEIIAPFVAEHRPSALVLTGGCALNVAANQAVIERFQLPLHVPPNPGDGGIGLGSVWAIEPPKRVPGPFLGPSLFDLGNLRHSARERGAARVDVPTLARMLAKGAVIGVARGNAEFGPRALGNRSILCHPANVALKDRLNREIKFREWYRPFAPAVPAEVVERFTMARLYSPYMSFAPQLRPEIISRFPAIAHIDGTARVQTVARDDHPWMHELLLEVGKITGYPILLNTSFNIKGRPLVNDVATALRMLEEVPLDHVLVEEWLFDKTSQVESQRAESLADSSVARC